MTVGRVVLAAGAFIFVWLVVAIAVRLPGWIAGLVAGVVVTVGALTAYTVMAMRIARERREGDRARGDA